MKVIMLKTKKEEDFDPCYAARLIEQGRAVAAPETTAQEPKPNARKK